MYYCQKPGCGKLSQPRQNANRVVVETRHKVYTDKTGKEQGRGVEIVREITVCEDCKKALAGAAE